MDHEAVREIAIIEAEDLDAIRQIAESHGVQIEEIPRLELEPVSTIALLLIGGALAVGAVTFLIEKHKGGQVIDLRSGSPRVLYRDKGVVYGLVIILGEDGTVTIDVKEPKEMFGQVIEVLGKLMLELGKTNVDAIATIVSAVLGDKATVSK